MGDKKMICADVIALHGTLFVLVARLGSIQGLALPGGKQDPGESLSETAYREMSEETGLSFSMSGVLGTYAENGRDPRGDYVSTVFLGTAHGTPREEKGKTRIILLNKEGVIKAKDLFVFDHFEILEDYFRWIEKADAA